jgi:hypothetical protein
VRRGKKPRTLVGRVVAWDDDKLDAALPGERLELVSEHDVVVTQDAVDHDRARFQVLHEGADRRDPDSSRDQQDLSAAPRVCREGAEWPFSDDARARRDRAHPARVKSPSAFTVMRKDFPSGARESENGWGDHQRSRVKKRQMKN